jgi:hypothetical protein
LAASAFYAVLAFIVLRRRPLWLRFLDASELFFMRLGFSKRVASFGRGFSEGRFFAISMAVFTVALLLLAVANASLYYYFRNRLAQG